MKESSLGGLMISPNSRDTKTITQSRNPGNEIPVKGEIITKELKDVIS